MLEPLRPSVFGGCPATRLYQRAIVWVKMVDPKGRFAGPFVCWIAKQIFCFLIDIAEVAAV